MSLFKFEKIYDLEKIEEMTWSLIYIVIAFNQYFVKMVVFHKLGTFMIRLRDLKSIPILEMKWRKKIGVYNTTISTKFSIFLNLFFGLWTSHCNCGQSFWVEAMS